MTLTANTRSTYGSRARILHLVAALLVMCLLAVGESFGIIPEGPPKMWAVSIHKLLGFVTLWIVLLWWIYFLFQAKPLPPSGMPLWQYRLASLTKWVLLLCATLMPLSGWLMGAARAKTGIPALGIDLPNPFTLPDPALSKLLWEVHETTANILLAALALHIMGALYHHFIARDNVLVRMFPFIRS